MKGWLIALCWLAAALGNAQRATAQQSGILVHTNGEVHCVFSTEAARDQASRLFAFGMPRDVPARHWLEDDTLPICHTEWMHAGIRYTQSVLLTSLKPEGPVPEQSTAADALLLVQLKGENTASDYTDATAAFATSTGTRCQELEFRDGLVYATAGTNSVLMAVVDIASSGVVVTNGTELRFKGNMPPGTSGAMVLKIPLGRVDDQPVIDRLLDLEFDQELRRIRKFWSNRGQGVAPKKVVRWAP